MLKKHFFNETNIKSNFKEIVLFIFRNLTKQYQIHKVFKQACKLQDNGEENEAFNKFLWLLEQEPYNPFTRFTVLRLGKKLNKEVTLPSNGSPVIVKESNKLLLKP